MITFEKPPINLQSRAQISRYFIAGIILIFLFRLWYLQIISGEYFRMRSENNLYRTVYVPPPRGLIYDRYGRVLVRNRPSFNVDFVVEDSPNPSETLTRLAEILNEDAEALIKKSKDHKSRRRFEPKLMLKDISRETLAKIVARQYEMPGIVINVVPAREYVYGSLGAHAIGYLREISQNQLDNPDYSGYRLGDIVGQSGIESKWEKYLQGERGVQIVIVNANGTRIAESSFQPEKAGHNITLTIDLDVQKAADAVLEGIKGAVVALNPKTGEVLALSSSPTFDPNIFASDISSEVWKDITDPTQKKLNNRAVQGIYPPASTSKTIWTTAALTENLISATESVNCPGFYMFAGRAYHCFNKRAHGTMDLKTAMLKSCNVYFYMLSQRLGIDRMHKYATMFGIGKKTGINLDNEATGIMPSTAWKKRTFNEKWYPGETLSVAVGQVIAATPIQMAVAYSAVANGGNVMVPYLVQKIESADGGKSFKDDSFTPVVKNKVAVPQRVLTQVMGLLDDIVNVQGGTGGKAKIDAKYGVKVGGKTGTAQAIRSGAGTKYEHKDHGWFVGVAPMDDPEIVVAIIAENQGGGGASAAPRANEVLTAYFQAKAERLGIELEEEKK